MRRECRVLSVRELETPLAEWLARTTSGHGGVLLLMGESGTGRTSALRLLCERARALGFAVADSWCRGDAAEPPHLPLSALLDALQYELGALGAPLQEPLERWQQNPQAWHLPTRLIYPLREIARQRPLLLALDDLHRAHENLQRTLLNWLVALRFEPIGLVLTATTPLRGALTDLQRAVLEREAGEVWTLRPFTPSEIEAIFHERLRTPSTALARTVYELTKGNPLFLSEILDSFAETALDVLEAPSAWIPDTLREALLRRLHTLSPAEQEIARTASLFESVILYDALPRIARQSERAVARGVAALQELGWLETHTGKDLLWRNRLFREVVYSTIDARARPQLHERAVEALQQTNAPELLILQQLGACRPTREQLSQLYQSYIRLRGQMSPRLRLQLLESCLHWATQLGETPIRVQMLCDRPYLLFQLPDGLLHALDASQQALAALDAYPEVDPHGELRMQVVCARAGQLTQLGRNREAQESLMQLLQAPALGDTQRLMAELSLAYVYACQGDLRSAYEIHRAMAERILGDERWLSRWRGVLQYTLRYALANGDTELAQRTLERVEVWNALPDGSTHLQMLYQMMYAEMAYFNGRGAEHQARARVILELAEELGEPIAALEPWFLNLLYRQPHEAVRIAQRALQLAQYALGQEREAEWRYRLAQALLEAGRDAEAIAEAEEARRSALKIGNQWLTAKVWMLLALARLAMHQPQEAAHALQQASSLLSILQLPELECEYALLSGLMDETQALQHATCAVEIAESWGHALYRGWAYALRARVLENPEDAEHAELLLTEYGATMLHKLIAPKLRPAQSNSDIVVKLLGEMQIRFRGVVMTQRHWASPRARALFAHLVILGGAPIDAYTLMEQHFPHLNPEKARVNLQTVISAARRSLRKTFGERAGDWILYENGVYRWAPTYVWRLDLHDFEAVARDALAIADPEAQLARLNDAINLYHGDLLAEFAHESWASLSHHNTRVLFLECLLARAQRFYVKAQLSASAADCERILKTDPTDENALRLMLQIYHQLGRTADAQQLYEQTQTYLAETLGGSLSQATLRTYESLFSG